MCNLVLEKAEEPEIKLPTSAGSSKKKRVPEKHLLLLYWLCQSLWLCESQQTGKFLKRWEYQTTLPASWETYIQVKKQQFITGHGKTDWFRIRKGVKQGYIISSCLFNFYAEYLIQNTTLMAENEEELKSLLMSEKEENEEAGLKLIIIKNQDHGFWSHHFMANKWGNNGKSDRLYFLGLQNHYRCWLQQLN